VLAVRAIDAEGERRPILPQLIPRLYYVANENVIIHYFR
jgi:hypothetical protein